VPQPWVSHGETLAAPLLHGLPQHSISPAPRTGPPQRAGPHASTSPQQPFAHGSRHQRTTHDPSESQREPSRQPRDAFPRDLRPSAAGGVSFALRRLPTHPTRRSPASSSAPTPVSPSRSVRAHATAPGPAGWPELKLPPCSCVVGTPKPLPRARSAPPAWSAVARQGPGPRGCGSGCSPPTPQPEERGQLGFISLFQPLPPARRWQKAGPSPTAPKRARAFLWFPTLPSSPNPNPRH